jgi:flavin reductase (DIM6/NTAB) family NADH-FMN oxidoreductase RutF
LGSGAGRLLLECALLLRQGLLGFSGPEALRAARLGCVHLGCPGLTGALALIECCFDLFIEIGRCSTQGLPVTFNLVHLGVVELLGGM